MDESHDQDGQSEHSFPGEMLNGKEFIGPCLVCGLTAGDAMRTLAYERDISVALLKDTLGFLAALKELNFCDQLVADELKGRIEELV